MITEPVILLIKNLMNGKRHQLYDVEAYIAFLKNLVARREYFYSLLYFRKLNKGWYLLYLSYGY